MKLAIIQQRFLFIQSCTSIPEGVCDQLDINPSLQSFPPTTVSFSFLVLAL